MFGLSLIAAAFLTLAGCQKPSEITPPPSKKEVDRGTASEARNMLTAAYYRLMVQPGKEPMPDNTTTEDLAKFISFDHIDSTSDLGAGSFNCGDAAIKCLSLLNGAVVAYRSAQSFGTADAKHFVTFNFDPDGAGVSPAISLLLYGDGHTATGGAPDPDSTAGTGGIPIIPKDPDYTADPK